MSASAANNVIPLPRQGEASTSRKPYTRLTPEARNRLVEELKAMDDPGTPDYRDLADRYDVSLRTVERAVAVSRNADAPRSATTGRKCAPLPENALIDIAGCRQRRMAWQKACAEGTYTRSYSTFTRQLNSQIGANIVAGAAKGTKGMNKTISQVLDRRPFMNAYTIDLFSLRAPFHVGRGRVITPMGMIVREDSTNMIINEYVFDTENIDAAMIGAVVGQAFRGRTYAQSYEDGSVRNVLVGGLPDFVYCDNAATFHARDLNALYSGLGVAVVPTNSYSSHENGAHERLHRTLRTQVLNLLPGSSQAPRDHRDQPMSNGNGAVPDIELARKLLSSFAYRWNTETSTDGPALDRWIDALDVGHVIRQAAPHELARLAYRHPETCQRYGPGVRLKKEHYFCPELTKVPSKRFYVHRWLGDDKYVEIFKLDGAYVGTAVRNGAQSAAESQATVSHNAHERRVVEQAHAQADPVRDQMLHDIAAAAPETAPGPNSVPAVVPGRDLADFVPTPREAERVEDAATDEDPLESLTLPPTTQHDHSSACAPEGAAATDEAE